MWPELDYENVEHSTFEKLQWFTDWENYQMMCWLWWCGPFQVWEVPVVYQLGELPGDRWKRPTAERAAREAILEARWVFQKRHCTHCVHHHNNRDGVAPPQTPSLVGLDGTGSSLTGFPIAWKGRETFLACHRIPLVMHLCLEWVCRRKK